MLSTILDLCNLILSSVNVIVAFSLMAYLMAHNVRSSVARAFCVLMAMVSIVYIVDITIAEVTTDQAANGWLRLQWIGIALVPAACFHFADALLRTTGAVSRFRRWAVSGAYLVSLIAYLIAASTDLIVSGISQTDTFYHLRPGSYFGIFAAYYAVVTLVGWFNISRARERCLTTASRRRMSYLMLAFLAPSIGVFPYLLMPPTAESFSANVISLLTLLGNIGNAVMTIIIGYIVAYQGIHLPDRMVKHSLLHFLLRGPMVATLVVAIMLTIPRVEHILGLPRDAVMIVTVAGSVVLLQLVVDMAKPAFDRVIYRGDRREITRIQSLDQRLLTTIDLEQLLENTLLALCDLLRVPSGFVVTMQDTTPQIRVFCGPRVAATEFLAHVSIPDALDQLTKSRQDEFLTNDDFVLADGHWLLPLRGRSDHATLGILGISALDHHADCAETDLDLAHGLIRRAEMALEDMRLQQQVFGALERVDSELAQIQLWRSTPQYVGQNALQGFEASPIHSAGFVQMVRDALGHLWGGPKLSQSPLLRLSVVKARLAAHDNVPAKALRSVLTEAVERLKPSGERSMTATEWVIYNILDLRFGERQRIRDIVGRLAMSESDYYRKQRVAIEQVADTLVQMEQSHETVQGDAPHLSVGKPDVPVGKPDVPVGKVREGSEKASLP